jgi:hypothetical protein
MREDDGFWRRIVYSNIRQDLSHAGDTLERKTACKNAKRHSDWTPDLRLVQHRPQISLSVWERIMPARGNLTVDTADMQLQAGSRQCSALYIYLVLCYMNLLYKIW